MGAAKSLIEGLLMPRRTPERGPAGRRRQSKIGARFGNGQSDGLRNVPISRPRAGRDSRRRASRLRYRSEEHTSELQSLMRISYAVFCLKKKKTMKQQIAKTV